MKEITIDGTVYVPKAELEQAVERASRAPAKSLKGKPYVIVRTYSAGVFAGYLARRDGKECELLEARRIWQWAGAASLSQLAVDGTSKPDMCKFPCAVPRVTLTEAIEVLDVTETARQSIQSVPTWKA